MDTEICEQADIYEQVREAVRQAVSDTWARIATRDDLNTLLLQLMPTPAADNVVRVSAPPRSATASPVRLTAREQEILERITAGDSNKAQAAIRAQQKKQQKSGDKKKSAEELEKELGM